MIEMLIQALSTRGLHVEQVAGTLNVRHGRGPMSRAVNLDPDETLTWVDGRPASIDRDVAGWANGVATTLTEPKHSKAAKWSFVEAAGSMLPTLESAGYRRGVCDATGGDPAWVVPFDGDDLVLGWVLRLGQGLRVLTESQFAAWGVTPDRVQAAGRSMLYHSTRELKWQATERTEVLRLSRADGHDAARVIVAADVFFTEIDDDWRFAMPDPEVLLAVRSASDTDALTASARAHLLQSDYPLDPRAWRLSAKGPRPADP